MLRRLARPSRRRQCPISVAPSGSDTYRSGVGRPLEIPGDGGTEDQVEGEPERSGEWEEQQGERDHEGDTAPAHGLPRRIRPRPHDHEEEADAEDGLGGDEIEEERAEEIALFAPVEAEAARRPALAQSEPGAGRARAAAARAAEQQGAPEEARGPLPASYGGLLSRGQAWGDRSSSRRSPARSC